MKFLLLLFFAFTTPTVLFLAALLYGGITTDNIKKTLSDSQVYTKVSENLTQTDLQIDNEYALYSDFVNEIVTPEYIKQKAETAIDESADWITGETQKPPLVSFEELKQAMATNHPELLSTLQNIPSNAAIQSSELSSSEQAHYLEQRTQISSFINQDFRVDLGNHLQGFKTVYGYLQIAFPMLIVVLLLSILMLFKLPEGVPAKCRWLGATLLITSVIGYGYVFGQLFIMHIVSKMYGLEQTEFLVFVAPIINGIYGQFVDKYISFQQSVNLVFLVCGLMCFIASLLTRKHEAPSLKPLKVNPSYWKEQGKKK